MRDVFCWRMVPLLALLWPLTSVAGSNAPAIVPLPVPRPAEISGSAPVESKSGQACAKWLESGMVRASPAPQKDAQPGCEITDPVQLNTIVLPDGGMVTVQPAALLRCSFALALANWVSGEVVKLLPPNQRLVRIEIAGAYECRGRNRVAAAKLSEHATGNAIDITAFVTGKDQRLEIARQASASAFFTALQSSACKTFMTVLGPGSDGFHETHLHLDLQQRSNGSHFCQWTVGG